MRYLDLNSIDVYGQTDILTWAYIEVEFMVDIY